MTPIERQQLIERQLDRTQAFFPRIDAKQSALLALSFALVGVVAARVSANDLRSAYVTILLVVFGAMMLAVFYQLFRVAVPHLSGGGGRSIFYFRTIAAKSEAAYAREVKSATADQLADAALEQVWRNSEIVDEKFRHLKIATVLVVSSVAPWTALLALTAVLHGQGSSPPARPTTVVTSAR